MGKKKTQTQSWLMVSSFNFLLGTWLGKGSPPLEACGWRYAQKGRRKMKLGCKVVKGIAISWGKRLGFMTVNCKDLEGCAGIRRLGIREKCLQGAVPQCGIALVGAPQSIGETQTRVCLDSWCGTGLLCPELALHGSAELCFL